MNDLTQLITGELYKKMIANAATALDKYKIDTAICINILEHTFDDLLVINNVKKIVTIQFCPTANV